jgi:type VI protein secretion system component Hcp
MRMHLAIFIGLAGAVCFAGSPVVHARGGVQGGGGHNTGVNVQGPVSSGTRSVATGSARKSGTKSTVRDISITKTIDRASP